MPSDNTGTGLAIGIIQPALQAMSSDYTGTLPATGTITIIFIIMSAIQQSAH